MIGIDLWDVFQQREINQARTDAGHARRDVTKVQSETARLEAKIDGLALISQAMWELVSERTNLRLSDIQAKVNEIDLRDGRKDGKITGAPTECSSCHRIAHTRQRVCMYCGTAIAGGHLFAQE